MLQDTATFQNKKLDDDVDLDMIASRTPGFSGADLANLLKSAMKSLNKDLVSIYPAMHACIAKHSMHKKRDF